MKHLVMICACCLFLLLTFCLPLPAQVQPGLSPQPDTAILQRLYARALDLSEAQKDSIQYYANYIGQQSELIQYHAGKILSLRLHGIYYETITDYEKAIDYYMQCLDEARRQHDVSGEVAGLTDLAIAYSEDMKQPEKSKEVYLQCLALNKQRGDPHALIVTYSNLGAIYNKLGQHDSALILLREGLRLGKPYEEKGTEDLSTIYNNMGNVYFSRKQYDEALIYFLNNYRHHLASHDQLDHRPDLWTDALNIADCNIEKGRFDSASKYANLSLQLANQLDSKSKQSDSYQILSKLYQRKGDYKLAWENQRNWYQLDTALVNGETYRSIADLEEKYEARRRENEKLLLQAEITQQKFHNRVMMIMAVSLLLIAIAAAIAFVTKRRVNQKLQATNDLVTRQNERLSELNYEKNSLISIVSHDLSTPFASIGMWTQLLQADQANLNPDQKKALSRIEQATGYGEKLIRHILDVEKAQTNQHKVSLETLDLRIFAESMLENFQPSAARKNIQLHLDCPNRSLYFLSDRQLLSRMIENLLSNAIKYTATGKNVWMSVSEEKDAVSIKVRDEGVGIEQDELPHLFSKYSKISSQPTNGEPSTGLGLAIVKRIVEELNGQISCESSVGEGSVFTVVLKK